MEYQFNTVEEALEELRAGHLILTIDDPDGRAAGEGEVADQEIHASWRRQYKRRKAGNRRH